MMSKTQNHSLKPVNLMALNDLQESTKRTQPSPRRLKVVNPDLTGQFTLDLAALPFLKLHISLTQHCILTHIKNAQAFLCCFFDRVQYSAPQGISGVYQGCKDSLVFLMHRLRTLTMHMHISIVNRGFQTVIILKLQESNELRFLQQFNALKYIHIKLQA